MLLILTTAVSAFSGVILKFTKDLRSPVYALPTIMINLVVTKSSGPKCCAVAFTAPILPVSVCVTQISVGGRQEG